MSKVLISIHALRGEGDLRLLNLNLFEHAISIHALRGEGDRLTPPTARWRSLFQSTPSEGRATLDSLVLSTCLRFQSTPSEGRATAEIHKNISANLSYFTNSFNVRLKTASIFWSPEEKSVVFSLFWCEPPEENMKTPSSHSKNQGFLRGIGIF